MKGISSRLDRIKPSPTLAVSARAAELRAEGVDVISFSAGEPDFDTPPHICAAANDAIRDGMTRYTPVAGIPALRAAVAEESAAVRDVPCAPSQVLVAVGAKHALYGIFQAIIDPGDEVIIPAPYWVSYPDQVLLAGGEPVIVETTAENNWTLGAEALRRVCTSRTKALVLNTPSNPTGAVYSAAAVEELVSAATELGLFVISDEIYRDLVYGEAIHTSPLTVVGEQRRERIVVVDGVSKTYAMTGWRIGWAIGDPDLISAVAKIQSQSTSNATSVAQAAALAAVTGTRDFLSGWKEKYSSRRDRMVERLNSMPGVECGSTEGAFYLLASFQGVLDRLGSETGDVDSATRLLEEARIAAVPGSAFGAPGHLRLSYATSMEAIEGGLDRLEDALGRL